MAERLSVPQYDPTGRAPGQSAEHRRRLLVLAAGAVILALIASSVANVGRASLRCQDGQLVPFIGRLLPFGELPMDDPSYPPLRSPVATCSDEQFESRDEFERRYVELAFGAADATGRPEERIASESAIDIVEALTALPAGANEAMRRRRRAMLEDMVEQQVEEARDRQQQALQWIERAREAGVDPAVLRAAERSLGLPTPAAPPASAPSIPADASDSRPEEPVAASRAL